MRNLKKVLALALATVMLLGMMAMASATDYTDAADINEKYAVAVDVMTAVGVFEGNPDGGFNPKGELTREAAAKIAVYVALTQDTAKYVSAVEAPFDDVAANRWSAGAIVAAKNLGLIDGNGDGTYNPTGALTGYAFAKMMLGVLGYKSSEEGFTGSGWEFNVNMAAAKAGLLKGLDASKLANTMTREEAAQMALNALKAQPVVYVGGSSVTINGITITTGAQKEAETDVEGEEYANLAAKLYPTLTWDTVVDTAFGYSTIQYKYGTTPATVATAKNYTVLGSYAGDLSALTNGALYTMTNKSTAAVAVYVNGADTTTVTPAKDGTTKLLTAYTGAKVDVVKNNGVYEVLITVAELDQVKEVTAATTNTKRTVTTAAGYTIETEDYADEQYILVYVKAGAEKPVIKHEAIAPANTAYGIINEVAGTAGAATAVFVDGTKYTVAGANVAGNAAAYTPNATSTATKQTVVLQNGYAIDVIADVVTVDPTLANYVYVVTQNEEAVANAWGAAALGYNVYETQVVYMDGTVATVKAVKLTDEAGTIQEMTANDDGIYTFADGEDFFAVAAPVVEGVAIDFEAAKVIGLGGELKAYTNDKTQLLTITHKAAPNAAFVKSAKLAALPTAGTLANAIVVYSESATEGKYDVELIVTTGTLAVAPSDLYYAVSTVLSERYDATAKKSYQKINVYEIATGEKKTIEIAKTEDVRAGFVSATVTDGIYNLSAAEVESFDKAVAAKKMSVYNGLLTIDGVFTDEAVADFAVIDTTTTGLKTVADLVAKNAKKAIDFTYYVDAVEEVTYIIVTAVK